ncbi:ATP-binding protein [Pseudomonas juntendi]|uniref:AAA family ATPase n=1 Tax=Pseudomonas juntendi TaxID=2666183 RepID=UPI00244BCB5E|nr:ATP-binding protein [Pseudomonas juntendi]MDG9874990.1 ATP-binding protein [Pseudomonas juntendi]
MFNLKVKDFSCIKTANLEISPLTLIIGPQASGKSVICKLIYFCNATSAEISRYLVELKYDFEALTKFLSAQFCEWFPASAWGERRFNIEFITPLYSLKISRISTSDKIRVNFSEEYASFYRSQIDILKKLPARKRGSTTADEEDDFFELEYRSEQLVAEHVTKWFGRHAIFNQLFIPAGRSFFTSIGKALIAFEHSGILEPLTLSFGRRFSSVREFYSRRSSAARNQIFINLFSDLLGGTPKNDGGKDYLQAKDGRLIPFAALSSGQQELIPLAMTLHTLFSVRSGGTMNPFTQRITKRSVYIEEPEAHLFPKAQSDLVEILASLISKRRVRDLVITTHSPYVLSKFNNLIKAGQLSKTSKDHKSLDQIIPESAWIPPRAALAYAIIDGKVQCITDPDGLIAADYLDNVSSDIIDEFSELLNFERNI